MTDETKAQRVSQALTDEPLYVQRWVLYLERETVLSLPLGSEVLSVNVETVAPPPVFSGSSLVFSTPSSSLVLWTRGAVGSQFERRTFLVRSGFLTSRASERHISTVCDHAAKTYHVFEVVE